MVRTYLIQLKTSGGIKIVDKQIFTKKEEKGTFGKHPNERAVKELIKYGIVNVDKPRGPTEV